MHNGDTAMLLRSHHLIIPPFLHSSVSALLHHSSVSAFLRLCIPPPAFLRICIPPSFLHHADTVPLHHSWCIAVTLQNGASLMSVSIPPLCLTVCHSTIPLHSSIMLYSVPLHHFRLCIPPSLRFPSFLRLCIPPLSSVAFLHHTWQCTTPSFFRLCHPPLYISFHVFLHCSASSSFLHLSFTATS